MDALKKKISDIFAKKPKHKKPKGKRKKKMKKLKDVQANTLTESVRDKVLNAQQARQSLFDKLKRKK